MKRVVNCPGNRSRARAIGGAVESIERSGEPGEIYVHDGEDEERIVLRLTVETVEDEGGGES